ncbi:hypothetical protein PHET_10140 [Paragonimus heterotremus]|uniref:Uncharacterized protein n=1 Tax=Paragonimus heterotremus TaxID=100268 RepID=A0A8J4SS09_9TREM|nr:hypothetical protein PHET_10140 [Paragonimus heterotremus]
MDQPVSAGSRGLTNFLHNIDDDLRQKHRSQLFSVGIDSLRTAAEQLLAHLPTSGRAVLGPVDSQDWPTNNTEMEHLSWERVDLRD